ncbi:prostate and testis expressed protein 4 [Carlito syrichta]|uniref:Prostate and testis expressed protein 4 n=1 Tax=Carlito syrichta TaxID=1868482 RepID=A0A1U7U855_CARSF|nr:prostate and testis expressed protein 4 [Carlito syrichta]
MQYLSFIKQASGYPFQCLTRHTLCHPNKHPLRKMNTLLLMSLSLLYLKEVMGLRCNTCTTTKEWKCTAGQGTCVAKKDELCSTTSYYSGEKHMYSEQRCKYKCREEVSSKDNMLTATLCCDKNFCNIF